jgi:DNA replication protein DnaC
MESKPSKQQVRKWLKKWKFPRRHIEKLEFMHGPSLEMAEKHVARVLSGDLLCILCGHRGPGKTQMAAFWGQSVATDMKRARYYKCHDLLCKIREQFDKDRHRSDSAREELEMAKKCHFLVLDEWSELAGTEWEKRTLTNLIDHRYDEKLSTVIITNHSPSEAIVAVGESIWNRAEETGGILLCDWQSYRKHKNEIQ